MARRLRIGTVLALLVVLGACTDMSALERSGTTSSTTTPQLGQPVAADGGSVSWESVVRADGARVATVDGQQLLRLDGVDPSVVLFADRPQRLAGELRVDELLALWHGGAFGEDPPNAAVVLDDAVVSVELRGAVLDPATSRVLFVVDQLATVDGAPAPLLPEGDLGPVTLFVDGTRAPVDGQITDPVDQTNVAVLGDAPAQAMGNLYQTIGASLGIAFENAQGVYQPPGTMSASTDQSVALLESMDTLTPG